MNRELVDSLRLDAGIAMLYDDRTLVALNKMGDIINPKVGLENFAELIVRECLACFDNEDAGDPDFVKHLIKRKMGVE